MPKQTAIPGLRDAMKKKVTWREQFLAEMEAVVFLMMIAGWVKPPRSAWLIRKTGPMRYGSVLAGPRAAMPC